MCRDIGDLFGLNQCETDCDWLWLQSFDTQCQYMSRPMYRVTESTLLSVGLIHHIRSSIMTLGPLASLSNKHLPRGQIFIRS